MHGLDLLVRPSPHELVHEHSYRPVSSFSIGDSLPLSVFLFSLSPFLFALAYWVSMASRLHLLAGVLGGKGIPGTGGDN